MEDEVQGKFVVADPKRTRGMVLDIPLREDFEAQLVIPRNITTEEARRIGAMLLTLALDTPPAVIDEILKRS